MPNAGDSEREGLWKFDKVGKVLYYMGVDAG